LSFIPFDDIPSITEQNRKSISPKFPYNLTQYHIDLILNLPSVKRVLKPSIDIGESIKKWVTDIQLFQINWPTVFLVYHDVVNSEASKRELYPDCLLPNNVMEQLVTIYNKWNTNSFSDIKQSLLRWYDILEKCDESFGNELEQLRELMQLQHQPDPFVDTNNENSNDESNKKTKPQVQGSRNFKKRTELLQSKISESVENNNRHSKQYDAFYKQVILFLQNLFGTHMCHYGKFPMFEIFYFNESDAIKKAVAAAPQTDIRKALKSTDKLITDTCILYESYEGWKKVINNRDWFDMFCRRINNYNANTMEDEANTNSPKIDPSLFARFSNSLNELQYIGMIKADPRRVDHVQKLFFPI